MKVIALRGESRTDLGKSATKALRKKGIVPCVSYGSGDEPTHFGVYEGDFKDLVYTPNSYLVMLDVNGEKRLTKLQEMQFHPVSEAIIHADFYEIDVEKPISVNIPIKIVGNSPGVRAGGKLQTKYKKLGARGMVQDLPEFIEVSIDTLEIGKGIRVKEIPVEGIELTDYPENTVISCQVTRAARSAATAAGGEEEEAE